MSARSSGSRAGGAGGAGALHQTLLAQLQLPQVGIEEQRVELVAGLDLVADERSDEGHGTGTAEDDELGTLAGLVAAQDDDREGDGQRDDRLPRLGEEQPQAAERERRERQQAWPPHPGRVDVGDQRTDAEDASGVVLVHLEREVRVDRLEA